MIIKEINEKKRKKQKVFLILFIDMACLINRYILINMIRPPFGLK
jgi:hypothetical protein